MVVSSWTPKFWKLAQNRSILLHSCVLPVCPAQYVVKVSIPGPLSIRHLSYCTNNVLDATIVDPNSTQHPVCLYRRTDTQSFLVIIFSSNISALRNRSWTSSAAGAPRMASGYFQGGLREGQTNWFYSSCQWVLDSLCSPWSKSVHFETNAAQGKWITPLPMKDETNPITPKLGPIESSGRVKWPHSLLVTGFPLGAIMEHT